MAVDPESDVVAVTVRVVRLLEELGVPYAIDGSLASSVHGEMRATADVDIVVDLTPAHVAPLVRALGDGFYVSEKRVAQAVEAGRSFNVIALEQMFKIDFFVAKDRAFEQSQLRRAEAVRASRSGDERIKVSAPEDVVLAKLSWYRRGGEISDRQWRDVLGVLRVKAGLLDEAYLRRMAEELGITDLLTEALQECGGRGPH